MSNPQYTAIFNGKVDQFLRSYDAARQIYSDEPLTARNYHNGEFGRCREDASIDLLKNTICLDFNISHGFVINHNGGRTTQCDVVIHDSRHHPIEDSKTGAQFFPVESVVAIGEIKSRLSVSSLCAALRKLSTAKQIRDALNIATLRDTRTYQNVNVDTQTHHTVAPFTFLICEEIEGFNEELPGRIAQYYAEKEVPRYLHHNLILSIRDGVFTYSGAEISRILGQPVGSFPYPKLLHELTVPSPVCVASDRLTNVRSFLINLSNSLENSHCFYPEPKKYLPELEG